MSLDESLVADNAQGVYGYQPTTVLGDPEVVGSGVALISTTGRMIVATEDVVAFSRVEHNGASFTGDLVHVDFTKPDGVSQFSIFGKRDEESGADPLTNLVGTIENEDGGLEQTYRLVKQSEPAPPIASIADIATTYRFTDEAGIVTVLTIDDQGGLSGTDTTGCTYSGQVYAPDSESHLIEAAYTASNCGSTTSVTGQQRDGSYNALGYLMLSCIRSHCLAPVKTWYIASLAKTSMHQSRNRNRNRNRSPTLMRTNSYPPTLL